MCPIVAPVRSDNAIGRWPRTVPLPVEGSNDCTASLLSVDPPPNTNRSLPIIAPAASWNACGTVPTWAMCPVWGE